MKIRIILPILFLITINLKAQNLIDTSFLFVYAKSGLKLRSEPNIKSETLALVAYSEAVKPIREIDAFYSRIDDRRGKWLEVNYQGQIGYMFSGFLSKLPRGHSFRNYKNEDLFLYSLMDQYFSKVLFQIGKKDTVALNSCQGDPDCKVGANKISYKTNLEFQANEYYAYEDYTEEKIGNWLFEDAVDLVESILSPSLANELRTKKEDNFIQYVYDGKALYSTVIIRKINEFQKSVSYGGGP